MECVKAELLKQNRKAGATLFAMNNITQDILFKQATIEYSLKHGVTSATKPTDRIFTVGRRHMMEQLAPWQTAHTAPTAILISIQRKKSR